MSALKAIGLLILFLMLATSLSVGQQVFGCKYVWNPSYGVKIDSYNLPSGTFAPGATVNFYVSASRYGCNEAGSHTYNIACGLNGPNGVQYQSTGNLFRNRGLACGQSVNGGLSVTIPFGAPRGTYSPFIVVSDARSGYGQDCKSQISSITVR